MSQYYALCGAINSTGEWPTFLVPQFSRPGKDNYLYAQRVNVVDQIVSFDRTDPQPSLPNPQFPATSYKVGALACHIFSFSPEDTFTGTRHELGPLLLPRIDDPRLVRRPLVRLALAELSGSEEAITDAAGLSYRQLEKLSTRAAESWRAQSLLTRLAREAYAVSLRLTAKPLYEYPFLLDVFTEVRGGIATVHTSETLSRAADAAETDWRKAFESRFAPYLKGLALSGELRFETSLKPADETSEDTEKGIGHEWDSFFDQRRSWTVVSLASAHNAAAVGSKASFPNYIQKLSADDTKIAITEPGFAAALERADQQALVILDAGRLDDHRYTLPIIGRSERLHLAVFYEDMIASDSPVGELAQRLLTLPAASHTVIKAQPIWFEGRLTRPSNSRYIRSLIEIFVAAQRHGVSRATGGINVLAMERIAGVQSVERAAEIAFGQTLSEGLDLVRDETVVLATSVGRPRRGEDFALGQKLLPFSEGSSPRRVPFLWNRIMSDPYKTAAQVCVLPMAVPRRSRSYSDVDPDHVRDVLRILGYDLLHDGDTAVVVGREQPTRVRFGLVERRYSDLPTVVVVPDSLPDRVLRAAAAEALQEGFAVTRISQLILAFGSSSPWNAARHLTDIYLGRKHLLSRWTADVERVIRQAADRFPPLESELLEIEIRGLTVSPILTIAITGKLLRRFPDSAKTHVTRFRVSIPLGQTPEVSSLSVDARDQK